MNAGSAAIRPWGPVPWLLSRLRRRWSVLGCLGAEERSLGIVSYLDATDQLDSALLIEVRPITTNRFYQETMQQLENRRNALGAFRTVPMTLPMDLFSSDQEIVTAVDSFASSAGAHVVLDISSFPKRFFFPLLKRLLHSPRIEIIVATYTVPESYGDGDLAEDHQPFTHLPLFGPSSFPERKPEIVIVGAGFMKLGLADLLEPYKAVAIRTLLPFPPGPPSYNRNWDFVRDIEKALPQGLPGPIRIEAYDCADAFDHISQLCGRGQRPCVLAPFGPKPISLAMALYAVLTQDVVLYTQPRVYHPFYSRGVAYVDGQLDSYAYLIRVSGRNLYTI